MKPNINLRSRFVSIAALLVAAIVFAAHAWTQQSTQERQPWEVQLAPNAQANSTITIQNQCQQLHSFNVIQQQTPFLQLLADPLVNVPGNSSYALPVRFNTNGLNAGQYQGTVIVKCQTCGKEASCKQDREILPIRLTVVENAKPSVSPQPIASSPISTPTPTPTPTPPGPIPSSSPASSPSPSPCAPTPTPTTYSVKDLSTLSESDTAHCIASGVNDAGNVVGACSPSYFGKSGGAWHAFRTEPGAVIKKADELSFPAVTTEGNSFATAVNGKGHVVGFWAHTGGSDVKAFWHDGGKKSKMISLHPAKSIFTISKAFALNGSDDVVGVAFGPTVKPGSALGMTFGGHAVLWPHMDPDLMTDLNDYMDPGSKKDWILIAAFGINDAKEIVGRALDLHLGKYHAFLLKSEGAKPIDLGALKEDIYDSSAAYAINSCGETVPMIDKVVGYTFIKTASHYGFVWTEIGGMKDMGTLTGYPESFAQAINKKGEVVGAAGDLHTSVIFDGLMCLGTCFTTSLGEAKAHAVWYNGIELKDLNKLIPAYPGWELEFANSINDKFGQIAGSAFFKGPAYKGGGLNAKAVLLTPAGPTPTAKASTGVTTSSCPLAIATGYVFDNWNVCRVKNGPTKDTTFTIDKDFLITFIATYHWNDGKGALPAKGISLKDSSGKVFGPWTVITSAGSGGRANVNWECHPGIVLPAGTYTIIDPDTSTWSQNDGSGNSGFVRVAGSPGKK